MMLAGLRWLASADMAEVPVPVQAGCLRGLEQALSIHAAARASALAAFAAQGGQEADGHGSPRTWLTWQTRVTRQAASAALAWTRRLAAHPAVADALADAAITVSWARQVCDWTDRLPADARPDADAILLAAARAGADLDGLARLAEEMAARLARPDRDPDRGHFDDRALYLAVTLDGASRLRGDLTPQATATLRALLDVLGKPAGPADTRTCPQRDHDALEEAGRRLIAAGGLPDRAGQPVQIQLHITLDELIRRIGAAGTAGTAGTPPAGSPAGGVVPPWPAAAPGYDCDASIAPIVTGRVDHDLLDRITRRIASHPQSGPAGPPGQAGAPPADAAAVRDLILASAVALLSGPGGLASILRTGTLPPLAASVSLPLDVSAVTDTIPPHLRRAVIVRDRHCAAPGCDQPPAACQIHHLTPRSEGGPTRLTNLILLCTFHHLIMIHRWGWTIRLNADGTTTATSPNGARVLHSHSPPPATAA